MFPCRFIYAPALAPTIRQGTAWDWSVARAVIGANRGPVCPIVRNKGNLAIISIAQAVIYVRIVVAIIRLAKIGTIGHPNNHSCRKQTDV